MKRTLVYEEKESGFPSFTSGVREAAKKNIVFTFGSFSGGLICKILHFYFLQSRILQIAPVITRQFYRHWCCYEMKSDG